MSTLDELLKEYNLEDVEETPEGDSTLDRLSRDFGTADDALDRYSPNFAPMTDEDRENLQPEYRGQFFPMSRGIREDGTYGNYFDIESGATGRLLEIAKEGLRNAILDPGSEESQRVITELASLFVNRFGVAKKGKKTVTPSTKKLRITAGKQYDKVKNMGAAFSTDSVQKLLAKIRNTEFIDDFPVEEMPKLTRLLKRLEKQDAVDVPIQTIIKIRKSLGNYTTSANESVARGAGGIIRIIDDFIRKDSGNVTFPRLPSQSKAVVPLTQGTGVRAPRTKKDLPSIRVADPKRHKEMADTYNQANANYSAAAISKTLENIPKTAQRKADASGQNIQDKMQREELLKKFPPKDEGKRQGLRSVEAAVAERINRGTRRGNIARSTGEALNNPLSRFLYPAGAGYGLHYLDPIGGAAIAGLAAAGPLASRYAGSVTKDKIGKLAERVRRRSPEGIQAKAEDTLLNKLGRGTYNVSRKIPKNALARALIVGGLANRYNELPPNQANMSRGFGGARIPTRPPEPSPLRYPVVDDFGNVLYYATTPDGGI